VHVEGAKVGYWQRDDQIGFTVDDLIKAILKGKMTRPSGVSFILIWTDFTFFSVDWRLAFPLPRRWAPLALLCIRRTLAEGRLAGVVSAGGSHSDAFYGTLAAFGLSLITDVLVKTSDLAARHWWGFLVYLGVATCSPAPPWKPANAKGGDCDELSFNPGADPHQPMTILSFVAILRSGVKQLRWGGAGGALDRRRFQWFRCVVLFLALGVGIFATVCNPWHMTWINRISGAFIAGCSASG
jgi:threonine/homoserine/homoserine lactone efflux protein